MAAPDAVKSLTFLASAKQNVCAVAVGAEGLAVIVTATEVLALSQLLNVWLA